MSDYPILKGISKLYVNGEFIGNASDINIEAATTELENFIELSKPFFEEFILVVQQTTKEMIRFLNTIDPFHYGVEIRKMKKRRRYERMMQRMKQSH